jgi:hypothetical protein
MSYVDINKCNPTRLRYSHARGEFVHTGLLHTHDLFLHYAHQGHIRQFASGNPCPECPHCHNRDSISKCRCRSRSNICESVIPLVVGAEVSIGAAETEDSSMEVVPARDFSPTELVAEDYDFAMEAESEEAESEVKLQRVELLERDDSVAFGPSWSFGVPFGHRPREQCAA